MKTTEQKAAAYDKALEKAKEYHTRLINEDNPEWANEIEELFSELAESEDEKIRKTIIDIISSYERYNGVNGKDMLAWLEKQKPFTEEDVKICHSIIKDACDKSLALTTKQRGWLKCMLTRMNL